MAFLMYLGTLKSTFSPADHARSNSSSSACEKLCANSALDGKDFQTRIAIFCRSSSANSGLGRRSTKVSIRAAFLMSAVFKYLMRKLPEKLLLVEWRDQLQSISVSNISYFWLSHKIVHFTTEADKTFTIPSSLDQLENELDPQNFFRVNRQCIIARKSIQQISIYFGNRLKISLKPQPEDEVIVSRDRVPDFRSWLNQ